MSQADSERGPDPKAVARAAFRGGLGQRIKALRQAKGLRPIDLARACDVSPGAVTHWENGDSAPEHMTLEAIAIALGLTLSEFWDAPIDQAAG